MRKNRSIYTLENFLPIRDVLRMTGKKLVFTNGCFDLLHQGHLRYLEAARQLGDFLVVGVNSDASVHRLEKGTNRPVIPEKERAEVLAALQMVDAVIIFDDDTPLALFEALVPDVLVKGGDWALDQIVGRDVVEANGGKVLSWPLVPGKSTTGIIESVRERYGIS